MCVCVCVKRRRRGGCGQLAQDALNKYSNVRIISWPFLSERFAFFRAQSPFLTELSRKQHLAGTRCHWTRGYNLSHFQSHSFVARSFWYSPLQVLLSASTHRFKSYLQPDWAGSEESLHYSINKKILLIQTGKLPLKTRANIPVNSF